MNRREFKELITYLNNRPEDARQLAAILNKTLGKEVGQQEESERGTGDWLTASQVGEKMGRSHQWVKDKDKILPDSAKRRGARGAHLYLWNDNTRHLFNIQL